MTSQKHILISGASTGIGQATALALAQKGHHVYAGMRKPQASAHPKITVLELDVENPQSIANCLNQIPHLDVLMNNAGIAVGGPLESVGLKKLKEQFEVNVFGLYELTRQSIPLLKKSKAAKIINVSSISGVFVTPFMGAYSGSKFAVEALSDAFRRELHKFNIQVVLLEPGPIATPIWDKSIPGLPNLEHSDTLIHYEPEASAFREVIKREAAKAVPVSKVTDVVEEIVESEHPQARYMINGKKLLLKGFSLLPEKFVDALIRKGMSIRK